MLVIADTSPLNYLVWIEAGEILLQLYGTSPVDLTARSD